MDERQLLKQRLKQWEKENDPTVKPNAAIREMYKRYAYLKSIENTTIESKLNSYHLNDTTSMTKMSDTLKEEIISVENERFIPRKKATLAVTLDEEKRTLDDVNAFESDALVDDELEDYNDTSDSDQGSSYLSSNDSSPPPAVRRVVAPNAHLFQQCHRTNTSFLAKKQSPFILATLTGTPFPSVISPVEEFSINPEKELAPERFVKKRTMKSKRLSLPTRVRGSSGHEAVPNNFVKLKLFSRGRARGRGSWRGRGRGSRTTTSKSMPQNEEEQDLDNQMHLLDNVQEESILPDWASLERRESNYQSIPFTLLFGMENDSRQVYVDSKLYSADSNTIEGQYKSIWEQCRIWYKLYHSIEIEADSELSYPCLCFLFSKRTECDQFARQFVPQDLTHLVITSDKTGEAYSFMCDALEQQRVQILITVPEKIKWCQERARIVYWCFENSILERRWRPSMLQLNAINNKIMIQSPQCELKSISFDEAGLDLDEKILNWLKTNSTLDSRIAMISSKQHLESLQRQMAMSGFPSQCLSSTASIQPKTRIILLPGFIDRDTQLDRFVREWHPQTMLWCGDKLLDIEKDARQLQPSQCHVFIRKDELNLQWNAVCAKRPPISFLVRTVHSLKRGIHCLDQSVLSDEDTAHFLEVLKDTIPGFHLLPIIAKQLQIDFNVSNTEAWLALNDEESKPLIRQFSPFLKWRRSGICLLETWECCQSFAMYDMQGIVNMLRTLKGVRRVVPNQEAGILFAYQLNNLCDEMEEFAIKVVQMYEKDKKRDLTALGLWIQSLKRKCYNNSDELVQSISELELELFPPLNGTDKQNVHNTVIRLANQWSHDLAPCDATHLSLVLCGLSCGRIHISQWRHHPLWSYYRHFSYDVIEKWAREALVIRKLG